MKPLLQQTTIVICSKSIKIPSILNREMLYRDIDDKDVTHMITDIPDKYKISNNDGTY